MVSNERKIKYQTILREESSMSVGEHSPVNNYLLIYGRVDDVQPWFEILGQLPPYELLFVTRVQVNRFAVLLNRRCWSFAEKVRINLNFGNKQNVHVFRVFRGEREL